MLPGCLPLEAFRARPTGKWPRTRGGIVDLLWSGKSFAEEREVRQCFSPGPVAFVQVILTQGDQEA